MLLEYGIEKYSINDLAVNEQNTLAKSFYEHMGARYTKEQQMTNREGLILFYI